MASFSPTSLLFLTAVFVLISLAFTGTVEEDLRNKKPPQDFGNHIRNICLDNPSLQYCNYSSPTDLNNIFRFTIVADHLCNESRNPNCSKSFSKIDLQNRSLIVRNYLSYTFFWKFCPTTITSIDLSNNFINGSFPIDILQCTQIQHLDLSVNNFSGEFPLENFFSLKKLSYLNLTHNQFTESKNADYSTLFDRFKAESFIDSGLTYREPHKSKAAVFLFVVFWVSVILVAVILWWLCVKRPDYLPRIFRRKHVFTQSMLKAATSSYSRGNLVAKIEGVDIYRGILRDDTVVRIEIYRDNFSGSNRERFAEECNVLVELCHRNLIQVLGWCNDKNLRAVVTEWTEGDSVETWLSESAPPWNQRLKTLMGVVEGMRYLHDYWPEVGYDLKLRSILISDPDDPYPLISRFKLGDRNSNAHNIYRFGIFVLEVIANRRPWQEFNRNETGFVDYIRENYPENVHALIDTRMELTEEMLDQANSGIGLGLMCTDLSATKYPSLNHIYRMIARVYESCDATTTQNRRRRRGDGGRGHRRLQST